MLNVSNESNYDLTMTENILVKWQWQLTSFFYIFPQAWVWNINFFNDRIVFDRTNNNLLVGDIINSREALLRTNNNKA